MLTAIIVMLMINAVLLVICYALCVIAHDADVRAERMHEEWEKEHEDR